MKDPDELNALANRIDHEELWRRSLFDRDSLTTEQRDRLDAGVYLRRYASDRFTVLEALKEGREYMRGYKFTRCDFGTDARGCGTNGWHGAINKFSDSDFFEWKDKSRSRDFPWMMYLAKKVSDEVPRMILLFENERRGLATHFKMCGHEPGPGVPLPDNHLRCALSKECRKCPYLAAIEAEPSMTDEAKDEAKAWTCATHILTESENVRYVEEFIYDKSDIAFHDRMARSLAGMEPPEPPLSPPDT